jgi:hemoglobin-like flavoprotein
MSESVINEALTPQQVHLLRKTFAQLARHDHVPALAVYRRLFETSPELRPMFKGDIEVQSKKLIEMLVILIAMLERPYGLEIELKEMGRGISVMG